MTSIEVKHKLYQRIHKSDILEILYWAHQCPQNLQKIHSLVFDDNDKVASNALWVLTWDKGHNPTHLRKYLTELVLTTQSSTIRRHSLTLLERMQWSTNEIGTDLIDFCFKHILMKNETAGIRAICVKLGYTLCLPFSELMNELKIVLDYLQEHTLPPAVVSARNSILRKINTHSVSHQQR